MEEADQLCERVAIIDHGKLLALDTPARTEGDGRRRHRGAHAGRRAISTHWSRDARAAGRRRRWRASIDDRAHVYVRAGGPALPELITHADRGGFHVTDVGVTEPTLETVFITLTGKDLRE